MRKQKKKKLYSILFFVLLCMTIGYAALTSNLNINGIANIANSSWDIHFDNIQVKDGSVTPDSAANIDTDTSVSYEVTLSQPGDYYEFNVDVVNEGTIDGMISTVSSKMNNVEITTLPSYLEYSVTYDDDIAIAPNQLLAAGTSETYKVRIAFKTDINPEDLPQTDETLNLLFTVTYVQADENAIPKPVPAIIGLSNSGDDTYAFRENTYKTKIKIINLDDEINPPANVIASWDIGEAQNGNVMAYITANTNDNTKYDLYIQGDGSLYANPDSSYLFYNLWNVDVINNIEILNTSKVTNMSYMFSGLGSDSTSFTLHLGDSFDTSKVTDMSGMFSQIGLNNPNFTLDLGSSFDTSNAVNMSYMFSSAGEYSTSFTLDLGNHFDTSKVTDMSGMFSSAGGYSTSFTLDLGNKFNTSKVIDMSNMFLLTGYSSTVFTLDLGNKFNTSKVTDMSNMFNLTGYSSTVFTLNLGNQFDTSSVVNMESMFYGTGYSSTVFTLNLGDRFDTSHVTNMSSMFSSVGFSNLTFTLNLGNHFDTSSVTNMGWMFSDTGGRSTVFSIDFGNQFDTSNVTNMNSIFLGTGMANSSIILDLSSFDFSRVTSYQNMFYEFFPNTGRIYVKNAADQNWIITNSGNSNLTTANVLIKS